MADDYYTYTCQTCQTQFRSRSKYRVHCSHACSKSRATGPRPGKDIPCGRCGVLVYRPPSHIKRFPNAFCSRRCANQSRSALLFDKPALRDTSERALICAHCGATFQDKPYRLAIRKYCSRACFGVAQRGRPGVKGKRPHLSGEKNPNYRGAQGRLAGRWVARRFYPQACIICGWDVIVEVHHILPWRLGGTNAPENLAVLCPNHHRMADRQMLSREELRAAAARAMLSHNHLAGAC